MQFKITLQKIFICLLALCLDLSSVGQVGIGTSNPDASSILDVNSTEKGFLAPRMTNPSSISNPASGLVIYNITEKCLQVNIGTPSAPTWTCLNGTANSSGTTSSITTTSGAEVDCSIQNVKSYGSHGLFSFEGNNLPTYNNVSTVDLVHDRYVLSADGKIFDTFGRQYGTSDYVKQHGLQYARRPSRLVNLDNQIGSEKVEQMIASIGNGGGFKLYDVIVFRTDAGKIYSLRMGTGSGHVSTTVKDRFNRPIMGPESRLATVGLSTDYSNRFLLYPLTGVAGANWTKLLPSAGVIQGVSTGLNSGDRMFAFNSTDNLWYSWGAYVTGNTSGNYSPYTVGDRKLLFRDAVDVEDGITPKPATILNKILADNNTSLYDPEDLDYASSGILFHKWNSDLYNFFLTTDGMLNVVEPDGDYIRYFIEGPTPGSVDTIIQVSYVNNYNGFSGTGPAATSYNHMLLTKSGNVYEISVINIPVLTSQDNTPVNLLSYASNQYISEQVYTLAQLDNMKFKYIFDNQRVNDNAFLTGISQDGILYSINRNPSATPLLASGIFYSNTTSISSTYSNYKSTDIPRIDKILSFKPDVHKFLVFKEKGTGAVWKYGYGVSPSATTSGSYSNFFQNLPHENSNNHVAFRTTGVNLDSAYYIPFFRNNNCASSYIVD